MIFDAEAVGRSWKRPGQESDNRAEIRREDNWHAARIRFAHKHSGRGCIDGGQGKQGQAREGSSQGRQHSLHITREVTGAWFLW